MIIVVTLLIIVGSIGFTTGYFSGKASVPSVYENVQGIRVLQHLLIGAGYNCGDNAPDGVLGGNTLKAYREYDKLNIGFVEDKLRKDKK